jgi:ribosomal peptide maturation radical SAM protein 1
VARHRVLDLYVVDNILDMAYLRSALPALAEAGYDLRMFYEIKSNLRRNHLAELRGAGVVHVQPGIENLSSRVLRLMDKGVSGCHNVRMLRDAEMVGLTVSWNYLYGFPGETDEDYDTMVCQFPALHHLQPPHGAGRLQVERFSPYFNQPELGFDKIRPHAQYALVYDLPETELLDLAYVFDAADRGIDETAVTRLKAAISEWMDSHHGSRLTQCDLGDEIILVSRRASFDWSVLRLCEPLEVAAFRLLDEPRTPVTLIRTLAEQNIPGTCADAVTTLLTQWRALGLTFEDDSRIIHVASQAVNNELLRLPYANGAKRKRALTHSLDEERHGADALA